AEVEGWAGQFVVEPALAGFTGGRFGPPGGEQGGAGQRVADGFFVPLSGGPAGGAGRGPRGGGRGGGGGGPGGGPPWRGWRGAGPGPRAARPRRAGSSRPGRRRAWPQRPWRTGCAAGAGRGCAGHRPGGRGG